MNYYNEHDIKTAQWLQALIDQKLIPQGHVDTRSIIEVTPNDLRNYTQCHFFAGIGGWPRAFQLAGVPATTRLWTGSCPCQPFSTAGKGLAQADERHLWPVFFELVRQCRPEFIFGEQVASAIGHGWLDGISADLEVEGYACGAAVLGAHSVGAPHIRQRLYWVADALDLRRIERRGSTPAALQGAGTKRSGKHTRPEHVGELSRRPEGLGSSSGSSGVADAAGIRGGPRRAECEGQQRAASHGGIGGGLADTRHESTGRAAGPGEEEGGRPLCDVAGCCAWNVFDLIPCADRKARRIEPGSAPLAHGIPARVVRLRGYGNAIVPQVAAEFIRAFYETQEDEDFC